MNKTAKKLIAAGCALALVAASAIVSNRLTLNGIESKPQRQEQLKLVVSGREYTPVDASEGAPVPYAQDGSVYLPLELVGEALQKSVEFDSETNTVYIGKAPLEEDALQLISTLEETHPLFALDAVPEGYEEAKAALLQTAQNPDCSVWDFTWAAMAYMAVYQDGHTRLDPFGGTPQASLDIGWVADGEHLYLTDGDNSVTDTEVVSIGGVSTGDLFALIDRYITSENQSAKNLNHASWCGMPSMLQLAGAAFTGDGTVTLELKNGNTVSTQAVGLAYPEETAYEHVITTRMIGDVFYADFDQCVDGSEMQAAVASLREAVQNGTTKVIIDVRGNRGGDSTTCSQLLDAMGMTAPQYGIFVRYSPLALQNYPNHGRDSGDSQMIPHPEYAIPNPAVKLVVLTDERTFSSATMMGVFVKDGKLGTLIGRPSSNSPNSYGDILRFQLNNTGTLCTVSYKQFLRPDQSASKNELTPDIITAVGEDALATALKYLAE